MIYDIYIYTYITYIYICICIYKAAVTVLVPSSNETTAYCPIKRSKVTGISVHALMGYRNMCFIDIFLTSHIETRICIASYSIRRGEFTETITSFLVLVQNNFRKHENTSLVNLTASLAGLE